MKNFKGIIYAALSSSTFGLAPLFSILLLSDGFSSFEVLSYRWGVASLTLGIVGLAGGCRFRISRQELCTVFFLSLFRAATSLSLVIAYQNISSGVASIIHFMYPLAVALAMALFFRERISWRTAAAIGVSLAGVTLALTIPLRTRNAEPSPLLALEHALHPWVAFGILPLFAFANAGVSLAGVTAESFTHHVPMGIAVGLLLGKTVGVFGLTWLAIKLGLAALPSGANWGQVLGVAILCGIGFTMSLFVGSLAFTPDVSPYAGQDRMGILTGSLFAALLGYAITAMSSKKTHAV